MIYRNILHLQPNPCYTLTPTSVTYSSPLCYLSDISLAISLVPNALKCHMIGVMYIERDTYTPMHTNKHPCIYTCNHNKDCSINLDCLLELMYANVLKVNHF